MSSFTYRNSDEVRQAIGSGQPVVALESTLISHGLPWPTNLETALEAESAVRQAGAIPATIAVIDGEIHIGLNSQDKERLARAEGIIKASPRDLPGVLAQRRCGATTVAGTIFIAHRVGIRLMATGGIGGVHRGAAETGDISADIVELARTPVTVVCSGAKSILDLPRTLELLETLGVPVVGYETDELPAFFARSSSLPLETRVDSPLQAAELIRQCRLLDLRAGMILANPPAQEVALPSDEVEQAVAVGIARAESAQVRGKAVTPFLLSHIREQIGSRAVAVNRAIIVRNARLAAEIACVLHSIHRA